METNACAVSAVEIFSARGAVTPAANNQERKTNNLKVLCCIYNYSTQNIMNYKPIEQSFIFILWKIRAALDADTKSYHSEVLEGPK